MSSDDNVSDIEECRRDINNRKSKRGEYLNEFEQVVDAISGLTCSVSLVLFMWSLLEIFIYTHHDIREIHMTNLTYSGNYHIIGSIGCNDELYHTTYCKLKSSFGTCDYKVHRSRTETQATNYARTF